MHYLMCLFIKYKPVLAAPEAFYHFKCLFPAPEHRGAAGFNSTLLFDTSPDLSSALFTHIRITSKLRVFKFYVEAVQQGAGAASGFCLLEQLLIRTGSAVSCRLESEHRLHQTLRTRTTPPVQR